MQRLVRSGFSRRGRNRRHLRRNQPWINQKLRAVPRPTQRPAQWFPTAKQSRASWNRCSPRAAFLAARRSPTIRHLRPRRSKLQRRSHLPQLQRPFRRPQKLRSRGRQSQLLVASPQPHQKSKWPNSCAKMTLARRSSTTEKSSSAQRRLSRLPPVISATRTTFSLSQRSSRRQRENAVSSLAPLAVPISAPRHTGKVVPCKPVPYTQLLSS